jgi:importin subunit beta-1
MNNDLVSIYEILLFLNGNDLEKRKIAEHELENLKKKESNCFLINLLEILDTQKFDYQIRRLAGLILKNEIEKVTLSENLIEYKWISKLNGKIRGQFKLILLNNFTSSSKIIRRTVSQILAKIAYIELQNKLWEDIFEEFSDYLFIRRGDCNFYEGILETLEFLFQEFFDRQKFFEILKNKFTLIFEIILTPIKNRVFGTEDLIFAALKTLFITLNFVDLKQLRDFDCDLIFSLVINQLTDQLPLIRTFAFEILELMVKKYYEKIGSFISIIFDLTLMTLEQDSEEVCLKAIEFWSTLADEEFQINLDSIQALNEGRIPKIYSKQFIMKSGLILSFILLIFIENRKIIESEDSNCKSSIGFCLNLIVQADPNAILPRVVNFIENKINFYSKARSKHTVVFSLIAIFEGIGSKVLYNHLTKTSFLLLSFSENDNRELRQTTLFLFGKIFQISPFILRVNLDKILQILLKNIFDKKNATDIYWILNEVFQSFSSEGLTEGYLETICSIFFNSIHQTISEGKIIEDLFEIICSLVLNSSTRSHCNFILLIPTTFKALKLNFLTNNFNSKEAGKKVQFHLFRFLGSSVQRFGQKFTQLFLDEIINFIFILIEITKKFKLDSDLEDEIINFIGTVVQKFKRASKALISEVMFIIFEYIKKNVDHQSVAAAIGIIGDVFSSFENPNEVLIQKTTGILINLLQNENIGFETKPLIISSLGDLSFAAGGYFMEFQGTIFPIVKSIIESIYNYEKSIDPDIFEWILTLKESLLEILTGLIHSNPDDSISNKFFEAEKEFFWLIKSIYEIVSNDRTKRTTKLSIGLIGDYVSNYKSKKKNVSKYTWIKQLVFESIVSSGQNLNVIGTWASESVYGG